jgi:hypothetical protein
MAGLLTNDEVLAKLAERMKDTPEGDNWRVKVFRKRIGGGYPFPIHLATLDGATLDQIANAEMWLPILAGGGPVFELECFHASDVARFAGGGRLRYTIQGEERPVNRDVIKQVNWHGPTGIIYPLASDPSLEPQPVFGTQGATPYSPGTPPGMTPVGGFTPRSITLEAQQPQPNPYNPGLSAALAQIEAMKQDMAERQRREEIAALERKHRMELMELEQKMKAQVQVAAVPQKAPAEIMVAIVSAAAPLVAALMESQKASRAEQQQALQAMQQQNMILITKAMEKPSIDPVMQQMMDRMTRALEDRPKPGEDMQPILEAFSRMTKMSTNSVAMAADLIARNSGQEEHPAMNIVREVRAAVEAVSEGIKASRIQPPARPPPQQYAQAPQQALPPPPPQQQAAPAEVPAPTPDRPATLLETIEARIRKYDDVESVGTQLIDAIAAAEPSVAEGMYAAGGNIIDLFQMRMGAWLNADPKNAPYIMGLAQFLTREAEKRGMLASPDEPTPPTEGAEAAEAAPMAQA